MAILLLDTTIEMQSALGTNKTITGISKAAEAEVTGTHDYAIGDLVVITGVVGMTEMNNRVVRVKSVSTTVSFVCEGLDSTGFTTYVSGGVANEVTTLVTFDNATGFNFPEPAPVPLDATTIDRTAKFEIFGLDEAAKITIPMLADPLATHVVAIRAASLAKTTRAFRVTLQTGEVIIFNAYVAGGRGMDGSVGAIATATCSLTLAANEQWFAS